VVIGGGPGGCAAATMLTRKGHDVVLFERERFPREHIGESLLPATVAATRGLGRPRRRRRGPASSRSGEPPWFGGSDAEPWSWYFRETNRRYPHSYQVERPEFDRLLLENCRRHGVQVHERTRVVEVLFETRRATGGPGLPTPTAPRLLDRPTSLSTRAGKQR